MPRPFLRAAPAALALVLAPPLGGCFTCRPSSQDWVALGFRTPEQTFRTFRTAVGGDEPDLEYRSLSQDFRARNEISSIVWREAREELRREQPWIKKVSCAEIVDSERLDPAHHVITAEIDSLFGDVRFQVLLVREEYWELYGPDGALVDSDELDLDEHVLERVSDADGSVWIWTAVARPPGFDTAALTEVRAATDWKIDDFRLLDDDDGEPASPEP